MKKILILLMMATMAISCTEDEGNVTEVEKNTEEPPKEIESSLALRATLENMKEVQGITGRSVQNELCFQFDYPIVLSYNDDSTVEVITYNHLLSLLLEETVELHIVGIQYPFDIIQNDSNQTFQEESEFQALISDCGYDYMEVNDVVALTDDCFTVDFPITVYVNGEAETFTSQAQAQEFFVNYSGTIESINFDYPFTVIMTSDDSQMTISDDYELIDLVENICNIE